MSINKVVRALADIYIAIEETSKPMDVHNSRPRPIPKNIEDVYIDLVVLIAEHIDESEERLLLGIRTLAREAIPISGTTIGYTDEDIGLAQMVSRATRR